MLNKVISPTAANFLYIIEKVCETISNQASMARDSCYHMERDSKPKIRSKIGL